MDTLKNSEKILPFLLNRPLQRNFVGRDRLMRHRRWWKHPSRREYWYSLLRLAEAQYIIRRHLLTPEGSRIEK